MNSHARLTRHYLNEVCEDQRAAMQDWIDALVDVDLALLLCRKRYLD